MKTINQIAIELLKFNKILIFCHIRPDGDTLGCAGALKLAFAKKGIKSDIVCDGAVPTKYSFLPVLRGVLTPSEVKEKYQAHLAVDVATELLLGLSWGIFIGNDNRYVIDHHSSNSRYVKDCYVSCAPAACIPVFDLICQMGVEIDSDIANCILLGIVTDTGNFSHNNADKIAFGYASKALEYGADLNLITLNLYKSQSKQRVKLYLDVMNGMRFYEDDKIAIITARYTRNP